MLQPWDITSVPQLILDTYVLKSGLEFFLYKLSKLPNNCGTFNNKKCYTLQKQGDVYCITGSIQGSGQVERASGFLWGNVVENKG